MIGTDSYHLVVEVPSSDEKFSLLDYRYSAIEVTAIDDLAAIKTSYKTVMLESGLEPVKALFLGDGNIRLYREFVPDGKGESLSFGGVKTDEMEAKISNEIVTGGGDDTMVAIVAIPAYLTASDLLNFISTNSYDQYMTHIRILKSERPNRFLVLIKFNDIVKTAEFQLNFNGKPFNSMEPETCHVVFVKSVTYQGGNGGSESPDNNISTNVLTPFLDNNSIYKSIQAHEVTHMESHTGATDSVNTHLLSLIELPTCPVCLEKMDSSITGLLTIPCQHTFHCQCLSKWKDDTCPVCRYSNNSSNQKVRKNVERLLHLSLLRDQAILGSSSSSNGLSLGADLQPSSDVSYSEKCADCQIDDNLWICLICGNLGCDRYAPEQHSLKHFVNTGHCFAMELNSSRVWDYVGDTYVHRLLTNVSDGKLVELPEKESYNAPGSSSGDQPGSNFGGSYKSNRGNSTFDKVDEVGFEYSQLLISQLASQREYYESLLKEKGFRLQSIPTIDSSASRTLQLEKKMDELSSRTLQLEKKLAAKDEKLNTATRDLNEARSLNEGLSTKVEYLLKKNEELEEKNKDLGDQVKDLMFFLESQEKFKDEPEEVKDGTIVIQQSSQMMKKSKAKSKKKK